MLATENFVAVEVRVSPRTNVLVTPRLSAADPDPIRPLRSSPLAFRPGPLFASFAVLIPGIEFSPHYDCPIVSLHLAQCY